jgi:hypothetical protein
MEASSICETSVNFYQTTQRNISEDGYLHTRRREYLKSHLRSYCSGFVTHNRQYIILDSLLHIHSLMVTEIFIITFIFAKYPF